MPERKLRLLIAETEYLIAIDAKGIIESRMVCEVAICSLEELPGRMSDMPWDLVLVDVAGDARADRRSAEMVLQTGAGLVFLTSYSDLTNGLPGFEEWPVVAKPFINGILVDSVRRALARAGKA